MEAYRRAHPEAGWRRMAKDLGLPQWQAKRIFEGLYLGLDVPVSPKVYARLRERGTGQASFTLEGQGDRASVSGLAPHQDLEAFLQENGVDLEVWAVEKYVINRWEMGAVVDGEVVKTPLYQIKAWLRRKTGPELDPAFLRELFAELAARAPHLPDPAPAPQEEEPRMAVLATPDLHVGKLAWGEETGENYDSKIALEVWRKAVNSLLRRLEAHPVELLILPLGNDLFHVDGLENTTTRGTRVDVDSRWQRAFRLVAEFVLEELLEAVRRRVPRVKVVMVPGNHDHQRVFYLGELLRAYYRNAAGVRVDNDPRPRKYYLWRRVLLGWTHGHRERARDLGLIMAQEQREAWARAQWTEWQVGHYHARRQYWHMPLVDERGVVVRVLPSLSGVDAWHMEQGFIGAQKGAQLIVYAPHGEEAVYTFLPPKEVYVRP